MQANGPNKLEPQFASAAVMPDLLRQGFANADLSDRAGLQTALEWVRIARCLKAADVATIRRHFIGSRLWLGEGRTQNALLGARGLLRAPRRAQWDGAATRAGPFGYQRPRCIRGGARGSGHRWHAVVADPPLRRSLAIPPRLADTQQSPLATALGQLGIPLDEVKRRPAHRNECTTAPDKLTNALSIGAHLR